MFLAFYCLIHFFNLNLNFKIFKTFFELILNLNIIILLKHNNFYQNIIFYLKIQVSSNFLVFPTNPIIEDIKAHSFLFALNHSTFNSSFFLYFLS